MKWLGKNYTKAEIRKIMDEMISKVDKDLLESLFQVTLRYSSSNCGKELELREDAIDDYLKLWANQKWRYYLLFDRNLILRRETSEVLSDEFFERLDEIFEMEKMKRRKGKEEIEVDISHFVYYKPIVRCFDDDTLFENVCPNNEEIKELFNGYYIPGQKLSRFFSKFFDDENFDIQYSKLFQNKVQNSFLNISIDPIDFLTIGTSNSFTNSCYALWDFYQGAGYSFMADRTSIVAFTSKEYPEKNRNIDLTYLNKINRFIIDVRQDFRHLSFNGNIVDSSLPQHKEYLSWIVDLLKKFTGQDFSYKETGYSDIRYNNHYNHIWNDRGPLYLVDGETKIHNMRCGYLKLPSLSFPKRMLKHTGNERNGWME